MFASGRARINSIDDGSFVRPVGPVIPQPPVEDPETGVDIGDPVNPTYPGGTPPVEDPTNPGDGGTGDEGTGEEGGGEEPVVDEVDPETPVNVERRVQRVNYGRLFYATDGQTSALSPNALHWVEEVDTLTQGVRKMVSDGEKEVVGISGKHLLVSHDGLLTAAQSAVEADDVLVDVDYGGGAFVAAGGNSIVSGPIGGPYTAYTLPDLPGAITKIRHCSTAWVATVTSNARSHIMYAREPLVVVEGQTPEWVINPAEGVDYELYEVDGHMAFETVIETMAPIAIPFFAGDMDDADVGAWRSEGETLPEREVSGERMTGAGPFKVVNGVPLPSGDERFQTPYADVKAKFRAETADFNDATVKGAIRTGRQTWSITDAHPGFSINDLSQWYAVNRTGVLELSTDLEGSMVEGQLNPFGINVNTQTNWTVPNILPGVDLKVVRVGVSFGGGVSGLNPKGNYGRFWYSITSNTSPIEWMQMRFTFVEAGTNTRVSVDGNFVLDGFESWGETKDAEGAWNKREAVSIRGSQSGFVSASRPDGGELLTTSWNPGIQWTSYGTPIGDESAGIKIAFSASEFDLTFHKRPVYGLFSDNGGSRIGNNAAEPMSHLRLTVGEVGEYRKHFVSQPFNGASASPNLTLTGQATAAGDEGGQQIEVLFDGSSGSLEYLGLADPGSSFDFPVAVAWETIAEKTFDYTSTAPYAEEQFSTFVSGVKIGDTGDVVPSPYAELELIGDAGVFYDEVLFEATFERAPTSEAPPSGFVLARGDSGTAWKSTNMVSWENRMQESYLIGGWNSLYYDPELGNFALSGTIKSEGLMVSYTDNGIFQNVPVACSDEGIFRVLRAGYRYVCLSYHANRQGSVSTHASERLDQFPKNGWLSFRPNTVVQVTDESTEETETVAETYSGTYGDSPEWARLALRDFLATGKYNDVFLTARMDGRTYVREYAKMV